MIRRLVRRYLGDAVAVVAAAMLFAFGALSPIHQRLVDQRFSIDSRSASGDIVLLDIDPQSLEQLGVWPWPRRIHARVVDALLDAGAAEIAFDVDFSLASNPLDDAAFEEALERAGGGVILPTFRQARTRSDGDATFVNRPLDRFARNSWSAGVNVFTEPDGRVRHFSYGGEFDGEYLPSLSAMYGGRIDTDRQTFRMDYSIDPATVPSLSIADLLSGEGLDMVRGKKVLVGATAVELHDLFAVPVHVAMPGVLLQILAAESISQGRELRETSSNLTFIGLALLFLLSASMRRRVAWGWQALGLLVCGLLVEGSATAIQMNIPLIVDTAAWQTGLGFMTLATLLRQIDIERLLLLVSRGETQHVRTILQRVVSDSFAGIIVSDRDGAVMSVNTAALQILDRPAATQYTDLTLTNLVPSAIAYEVEAAHARYQTDPSPQANPMIVEVLIAGERKVLEFIVTFSQVEDVRREDGDRRGNTVIACLTFSDITVRQNALNALEQLARFDPLTGLANRNRINEVITATLEDPQHQRDGFFAIYFDLNRFKNINDTLGHQFGDRLLITVGERGQKMLPKGSTLSRFGGDEFVAIVPGICDRASALTLTTDLLCAIAEPYEIDNLTAIVGARAGIMLVDRPETSAEAIIRNADVALHHAKHGDGGAVAVYEQAMNDRMHRRRDLELDLFKALERDEFEVFYQAQIDFGSGRINGAEALIRWHHPQQGLVSPAEFIPILEDIGLIGEIGAWILNQACKDARDWPSDVKVAVNLSTKQFQRGDLAEIIADCLARTGLPKDRLELEITESILAEDGAVTQDTIAAINQMGIPLALDDFGTGYSSLSYIQRFPLAKIKIDQSFVMALPESTNSLAIIRAITSMAEPLGLRVIAEGVETEEQAKLVHLAGCDQGQGFLYSKPIPNDAFVELLSDAEFKRSEQQTATGDNDQPAPATSAIG